MEQAAGGNLFGALAVVIMLMAAAAPLLFSIMAKNAISIAVSLVLLVGAGLVITGPTVIHEILAAVLYLAALVSASVIYGAHAVDRRLRDIVSTLKTRSPETGASTAAPARAPGAPVLDPASDWAAIKAEIPARSRP